MSENTNKKWNDESVNALTSAVAQHGQPVLASVVESLAETLQVSARSVAAKLRQLGFEVASMAKEKTATFNQEQGEALAAFVRGNSGALTYKQIAEQFMNGSFTPKQVQGKILALELTSHVKPTEKVEAARTYSEAEEAKFIEMAQAGAFIEDIAAALGKEIPSIRGKALSLTRSGQLDKIPSQKESHAKTDADPVQSLGDKIATMTVAEIAKAVDKTERGIRTLLTRRGIKVADYDGEARKTKAEGKAAKVAA